MLDAATACMLDMAIAALMPPHQRAAPACLKLFVEDDPGPGSAMLFAAQKARMLSGGRG